MLFYLKSLLRNFIISLLFLSILSACDSNNKNYKQTFTNETDLLNYGIPLKLKTPDSVNISDNSDSFMKDIVIQSDRYYIQIYSQNSSSINCSSLAKEALNDNRNNNQTFKKLISEEECGYIYSVQVEGDTSTCYNFEYYKVLGNKSFKFTSTTAFRNPFKLNEIEVMFESIKNSN